ncbi:hypothetical protein ACUNV4_19255 [Granulosicoccus sp. 3-233]|uniref:hypothetical protein n=1 Tax=Granulosicoccus sp. 3-233 TaxID=3417969 RepID=UPI003D341A26
MSAYVAITGSGLVTSLGNDSPSTCAAIRCHLDNIQETPYTDSSGQAIRASLATLVGDIQGEQRLIWLAAAALQECLDTDTTIHVQSTPLILCLPQRERPGRPIENDDDFLVSIQDRLGRQFSPHSRILDQGHVAVAMALRNARQLLDNDASIQHVLIASADTLCNSESLSHLEEHDRLLTHKNSDGLIPGEAGAALIVKRTSATTTSMHCLGLGFSMEPAPILSDKPCRADGLATAIRGALQEAQIPMQDLAYRITDLSGEHYYFREASLALSRTLRVVRDDFDLLHPAEYTGDTGAALGLIILAYQQYIFLIQPPRLPQVLVHLANDDGRRAAIILGSE